MSHIVDDFTLRYGDRVLAFHAYVNTDRDADPLGREMQRVARGPQLEAQACWLEGYNDGLAPWNAMLQERAISNGPVLKHSGRVLVFHLFINTDRDPYHIHKAVLRLARGPRLDACVVWSELYEGENARNLWREIQKVVTKVYADPRARPFDAAPK